MGNETNREPKNKKRIKKKSKERMKRKGVEKERMKGRNEKVKLRNDGKKDEEMKLKKRLNTWFNENNRKKKRVMWLDDGLK